MALMKIAIFISLSICFGYFIGGLNAIHVAKALAEENSTSLSDISRRLENGFFYFRVAGVFAVIFLAGTYAVWHRTKISRK
jgi:Na+/H+ antiporter NhaC